MKRRKRITTWFSGAALASSLVAPCIPVAHAGVEFVTSTTDCTTPVDRIGDDKDLFIAAGEDVKFEVFGNSVDLSDRNDGFRITGGENVDAEIIEQHSGVENLTRGCGNTGSAVVSVESNVNRNTRARRSVLFTMPLGVESRLRVTVKPLPKISAEWTSEDVNCIVQTGSVQRLNQNKRMQIELPPGHTEDATNCFQNTLWARVRPEDMGELDIRGPGFRYEVTGMPAFLTQTQELTSPTAYAPIRFEIDVEAIRALTEPSQSTITIRSPNADRTATLRLNVFPNLGEGFTVPAACTPQTMIAGGFTDCKVTVASPAGEGGQPITWRMQQATCFPPDLGDDDLAFDHDTVRHNQTELVIRVWATGSGCENGHPVVPGAFDAWIGDSRTDPQVTAPSSGPTHTSATVSVINPDV